MLAKWFGLLFFTCFMSVLNAQERNISFSSNGQESQLVELYTSQGCSSCPPAERWISNFKHDKKLWQSIFPLAFHVDYWDYIGWKDEFAKPEYGTRQRQYKRLGRLNQVATPGFVVSGEGWSGWYRGQRLSKAQYIPGTGDLKLDIQGSRVEVSYLSDLVSDQSPSYRINFAVLGFDILSKIGAGENRGRNINQDFVVLSFHKEFLLDEQSDVEGKLLWKNSSTLSFDVPTASKKHALVAWVSQGNDPNPIQIAGGWL